jgi:methoxy mycolic acid synthase MmaA3
MPDGGVMLLHSITGLHVKQAIERGIPLTMGMAKFIRFIVTDIFPRGRLPMIETIEDHTAKVGFEARRDEAIAIQSQEVYERYMKYLTGCANAFRIGYIDVNQFILEN